MKIVIAGAGEVGTHLAKMLTEGNHDITIVDDDEDRLSRVSESVDVLTVNGNPSSVEVLRAAGADSADLFVSVIPSNDQSVNIVCALLAKRMGAGKVTARISNSEYLKNENKIMFTEMGVDLLFYPEKIAVDEIMNLLRQSEMTDFIDFANGRLQLVVLRLQEGAPIVDKTILEAASIGPALKYRTVAISRDGHTLIPLKDTIFKEGDLIYVAARRDSIPEVLALAGKEGNTAVKRLTIIGGGKIGSMLADRFEDKAEFIKLIEIDRDRCDELVQKLDKTLIINGDGRNSDLLYEEDVKSCDAFVAVTSSSETNILACVAAKNMGIGRTIAQVENIEYIKLAEGMGVDAVINKKIITAGRIFRFTLSNTVRTVKVLNGSDAETIEYIVKPGSRITKAPVKELDFPKEAVIGGVIRGSETIIADGNTLIHPYDRVVVFALPTAMKKVEYLFS